jgi:hypothetical protein
MEEANRVPIELAVAIPTFIGSLLSFLATSIAIIFHIISPPSRHFRHALIINLLVAGMRAHAPRRRYPLCDVKDSPG